MEKNSELKAQMTVVDVLGGLSRAVSDIRRRASQISLDLDQIEIALNSIISHSAAMSRVVSGSECASDVASRDHFPRAVDPDGGDYETTGDV